jgi:hypothetical protein
MTMSKNYNERQIEAANLLKSIDQPVPDDIAEQVIGLIADSSNDQLPEEKQNIESVIKIQLLSESDWRKRAVLSAMLISKSLE